MTQWNGAYELMGGPFDGSWVPALLNGLPGQIRLEMASGYVAVYWFDSHRRCFEFHHYEEQEQDVD